MQKHHIPKKETDGPLTCESISAHISWNDFAHSGVRATNGRGLDQVASDGLGLGAPGQRERRVFHLRDAHAARRTYICIEGKRKQF